MRSVSNVLSGRKDDVQPASDTYQRLLVGAGQRGAPVETVAEKLLTEQLAGVHLSERDRVTAGLQAAGLLKELSPDALRDAMLLHHASLRRGSRLGGRCGVTATHMTHWG